MADLGTFLKGYDPYGSTNALNRKQLLAQQLTQQGSQATNPLIALLAGTVGSYQLAESAKEQAKIDKQETELKKALLLNEEDWKNKNFGLQERQLGISAGTLDLQRQKLAQELMQTQQQQSIRNQLLGALTNQPMSAPSPEFQGPMPIEKGITQDPNKLGQVATIAALTGDKDLASSLSGVIKAQADVMKAGNKTDLKLVKFEQDLRKEFSGESKPFKEIAGAYNRIQATASKPSAAGDLALIFNYMKMLDPGSTVREGEFANAQNAAGVPERLRAQYNNVTKGERLTEVTRADFLAQANNIYSASKQQQKQLEAQYSGLAAQSGIDPKNVVTNFGVEEKPKKADAKQIKFLGFE